MKFPFFKKSPRDSEFAIRQDYLQASEEFSGVLYAAHKAYRPGAGLPNLDIVARANPGAYKRILSVKGTERGLMAIAVLRSARRKRTHFNIVKIFVESELTQLACRLVSARGSVSLDVFPELVKEWIDNTSSQKSYSCIADVAEELVATHGLTPDIESAIRRIVHVLEAFAAHVRSADCLRQTYRFRQILDPQDAFERRWNQPWEAPLVVMGWGKLLNHAEIASSTRMSNRWAQEARNLLADVGTDKYIEVFGKTVAIVSRSTAELDGDYSDRLRGLAWMAGLVGTTEASTLLVKLMLACTTKSKKGFGAAVQALESMGTVDSIAKLSNARNRIKAPALAESITAALTRAAGEQSIPVDELEELVVPTYGLELPGVRTEILGTVEARLEISGSTNVVLWWFRDGKELKSPPVEVKDEHSDSLKELKSAVKDISTTLTAQRSRIEGMMLSGRNLSYPAWRERYVDHPLLAQMSRRLVWRFSNPDGERLAMPLDGVPTDIDGRVLVGLDADTTVRLWHPVQAGASAVESWREFLVEREICQPFKQAHREVYVLTAAEEQTGTYSNRFAAHVLKQNQLSALARARGWRFALKGAYFDYDRDGRGYNPYLELPQWGIRAEFYVEAADIPPEPGAATFSDSGMSLYVVTDQVRFGDLETAAAFALETVPPVVFSEVMRDVDLFVGVASVGNDPTWQDQGQRTGFGDYWRNYSFGNLSATADTRKVVIERLLPRLAISKVAKIDGKFLVVEGKLHTYKIHLGSSNILMSPNNQYLCIVMGSAKGMAADAIYLPFEGDRVLAIILSKALMLANDDKITDRTIKRQIQR